MSAAIRPNLKTGTGQHTAAVADAIARQTPDAALDTLNAALRWTIDVLREVAVEPDDATGAAFGLVEPLAAALAGTRELTAALPAFLAAADAGGPFDAELERRAADLAAEADAVAALRADIDRRAQVDRELVEQAREYRRIRDEVDELRRAEELVADLPRLTALHQDLVARIAPLRAQVDDAEEALRLACGEFVELAEARLAVLRTEVRRGYAATVAVQRELHRQIAEHEQTANLAADERDRLETQLAEARTRLAELTAVHETLYAEVAACGAADREVTAGIGGLRDAELLLRTVDEKLAAALAVHERVRRRERAVRFPGDEA